MIFSFSIILYVLFQIAIIIIGLHFISKFVKDDLREIVVGIIWEVVVLILGGVGFCFAFDANRFESNKYDIKRMADDYNANRVVIEEGIDKSDYLEYKRVFGYETWTLVEYKPVVYDKDDKYIDYRLDLTAEEE